jgi:hypothetical protein
MLNTKEQTEKESVAPVTDTLTHQQRIDNYCKQTEFSRSLFVSEDGDDGQAGCDRLGLKQLPHRAATRFYLLPWARHNIFYEGRIHYVAQ